MPAYKDKKTGLFYVQFYYRDARGAKRHKTKKGFQTELEALLWEKNFKALKDDAMDMTFADFCKVYESEVRPRVREHTWLTKEAGEMQFWTKDKHLRFSDAISDKPLAFYAFEVLYWMGIRCGELMALTPSDFLLETSELRIDKSY